MKVFAMFSENIRNINDWGLSKKHKLT